MVRRVLYHFGAIAILGVCGCERMPQENAYNAIAFQRKVAEHKKTVEFVSGPKEVRLRADIEYPVAYGLSETDHDGLVGFVDHMLNSGTNFESAVESMASDLFDAIQPLTTNENLKADADFSVEIVGNVNYSDDRYLSCEMSMRGVICDYARAVYDRKQQKPLVVNDFVSSNDYPRLRAILREHVKLLMTNEMAGELLNERGVGWPSINENFYVDADGIEWLYNNEELGFGGWVPLRASWADLKPILVDQSMIPTGRNRYVRDVVKSAMNDGSRWWMIPYTRMDLYETTPPDPPWSGTNYPYSTFKVDLLKPVQGTMSAGKFERLLDFIGGAIAHGKEPHGTIDEAVNTLRMDFWSNVIKDKSNATAQDSQTGAFDQFEMGGEIKYATEKYFCYGIRHQRGCPCCSGETNIVWRWSSLSAVGIEEIVDVKRFAKDLGRLLRAAVVESFKDDYADNMDVVLPDYAKDWPRSFGNFYLTAKGITWSYDAGEVLIGGKGTAETSLSWEQVRPYLTSESVLPDK